MLELFLEELAKASDRIKSGVKTQRHSGMTNREAHTALTTLLNDPNMPSHIRNNLVQAQKHLGEKADKEEAMSARAAFKAKQYEPGKDQEMKAAKEAEEKAKVDAYLSQNQPKKIDKLGGQAQYEQDVNNPKMRSKAAEQTSSGVKDKLMGENVAIRDKKYGQALDAQAQIKAKQDKIMAAKGPEAVIRVSNAPEIPDEHKSDAQITNLMALRPHVKQSEHVAAIDKKINDRITELSSMKKSREDYAVSIHGQWRIK